VKEMQRAKLKDKIITTIHPQKLVSFSGHLWFYTKYAVIVSETLKKPLVQKFLNWIIKRETIEKNVVKTVKVMVFPYRKKNGKGLAGRYKSKGEIILYPKRLSFFRNKMRKCKKQEVHFYIRSRAMATLIHEFLHAKYLDDEDKVRELTKRYLSIFIRHQYKQNSNANSILETLFT
jgi:hypothetical protein